MREPRRETFQLIGKHFIVHLFEQLLVVVSLVAHSMLNDDSGKAYTIVEDSIVDTFGHPV